MKTPLIMLGAGGHASVLIDLALRLGHTILGVCAPQVTTLIGFPEIPYLGNDDVITKYSTHEVRLINGIGAISVQKNKIRSQLFEHYKLLGYTFETLVHPSAIVASAVQLDEGVQVMAGAIIQSNVAIGKNAIVNTGACIDHDCRIAHSVHVAPRVVLSGNVIIGGNSMIGVGAVIIQSIHIEENTMIRAGSIVTKNMTSSQTIEDLS